jgi:hypothetical protein
MMAPSRGDIIMRHIPFRLIATAAAFVVVTLSAPLADAQEMSRRVQAGVIPGCMAECPAAPKNCVRSKVDPGACANKACKGPAPVCHYVLAKDEKTPCKPAKLTGRCIPPT